jgi:hypothetical protein
MSSIEKNARAIVPGVPVSAQKDRRPWATWASLGWYIVIFEIAGRAYEHLLNDTGLQAFLDRRYGFHVLIGAIAARKCVCMTITGRGHAGGFENVF